MDCTGDGAGVGKGRTIAGIIFENFLKGRKKAIWVSVSNDLKYDAERDLSDVGAGGKIEVYPLNKVLWYNYLHYLLFFFCFVCVETTFEGVQRYLQEGFSL